MRTRKKKFNWFSTILGVAIAIYLIDLNIAWYHHSGNSIPILKYSIIGMSAILFLIIISRINRNGDFKN